MDKFISKNHTQWTNRSKLHRVSKKPHLWLAITLTHVSRFWHFFGSNATDKVSNQKMLYYATSNNLCFCTTWQNEKYENCTFHLLYQCMARIKPVTPWFLQYFWLTTHTCAAVWLPNLNLVMNEFSLRVLRDMVQQKGSWERHSSWTALHALNTSVLSSGFPLSQRLISYFLSNTSAKNYRNRIVYVKIIASQRWDVFLGHSVQQMNYRWRKWSEVSRV